MRSRSPLTAVLMFAAVLAVYLSSRVMVQNDSLWSVPIAASLWLRGDTTLDEYTAARQRVSHGVDQQGEHTYGFFPLGASLVALPVVATIDLALGALRWFPSAQGRLFTGARRWATEFHATDQFNPYYFDTTERFVASLVTSLAVLVFFLATRRQGHPTAALVAALMLAFATSAWSTASRGLWQHGPSMLLLSIVLALLLAPGRSWRWALLLGATVAAAYVFRPTNVLTAVGVTVYLAARDRRLMGAYLGGAMSIAVPFVAYNQSVYGAWLPPYFTASRLEVLGPHFLEALAGNLVSPSRGLFVFSPVLLVSLVAVALKLISRTLSGLELLFAAIIASHWVVISSFPHWWAGHSVGPRFFTDVLPFAAWFLIEPLGALPALARRHRWVLVPVVAALAVSVFAHWRGATSMAVSGWNGSPTNVDLEPSRVWDWSDPQFLR